MNTTGYHSTSGRARIAGAVLSLFLACSQVCAPTIALAEPEADLQAQLESASARLDTLLAQTSSSIDDLQETRNAVDETQVLIDTTRDALNTKAQEVASMQRDYATLIASDYKNHGNVGVLSFCLGATNFEDLVSRVYYADRISEHKHRALRELRSAQEDMMSVQRDLQTKKAALEELAVQQESKVSTLQEARTNQQSYIESLPEEVKTVLQEEKAETIEATNTKAETLIVEADKSTQEINEQLGKTTTNESTETRAEETTPAPEEKHEEESNSDSNESSGNNDTPASQPADSNGGSLSDVADYFGPEAGWSQDVDYIASQRSILEGSGSSTSWGCVVDKGYDRCTVFHNDGSGWKAAMTTDVITTGHTFTGTWDVVFHARAYWALPDGYDVNDWWVCFIEAWSGDNYSGHLRYEEGKGYDDGQGFHFGYSSGGCTVISDYSTAQWLYDHVPDGSRVIVH